MSAPFLPSMLRIRSVPGAWWFLFAGLQKAANWAYRRFLDADRRRRERRS